jgi:hypothetical protein
MENYIVELDKDQLAYISKALDFITRIQTGRIMELTNPHMISLPNANYKQLDVLLMEIKKQMFPDLTDDVFYSVKSKFVNDSVRQMIDISDVIKFTLKDEKEKKSKPFHWFTEKPLVKIKKMDG